MTKRDRIAHLKSRWPKGQVASREVLSLAALAVRDYPQSAMLWFLRGKLITMAPDDYIFSELDAVCSFQQAIELDPNFADAYEALGHYHEGVRDDPEKALEYYRKAAKLRADSPDGTQS